LTPKKTHQGRRIFRERKKTMRQERGPSKNDVRGGFKGSLEEEWPEPDKNVEKGKERLFPQGMTRVGRTCWRWNSGKRTFWKWRGGAEIDLFYQGDRGGKNSKASQNNEETKRTGPKNRSKP